MFYCWHDEEPGAFVQRAIGMEEYVEEQLQAGHDVLSWNPNGECEVDQPIELCWRLCARRGRGDTAEADGGRVCGPIEAET